jgi:hypothetical protein
MENNKSNFLPQLIAGTLGGVILGVIILIPMASYGGNYGCWAPIDSVFGTRGYESCGAFGAITGILIGSIIGITIATKVSKKTLKSLRNILGLLAGILVLPPFLYGIFKLNFKGSILIPLIILATMLVSAIPSLIIIGIINWRKRSKRKSSKPPQVSESS